MKVCGKLLGVLACLLLLGACAKKEESKDAEFLNVQLEGSEMWSLVNVETGKLEFKNEFFAPATSVVKGSFFVQNKEGLFDLFNLKDTKNRLNSKSYSFVTNFNGGGFAIVRVNDEPWQVINTEGKTIATLDKDLSILSGFSPEGMAIFKNKEDMYGFVNTAGALAIKPRYLAVSPFSGGVAVVKTKEEDGKSFFAVIDEKATELFRFSSAQYSQLSNFNSGYAFALEGENIILLNKQGRKVANVGTGSGIGGLEVSGDAFIYPDRGYYGVKNINDEILIRAKYAYLEFTGDGNLLARDSNGKYGVVDKNDNEVVPFDYSALEYIAPDRYLTTSGSLIILIDAKGKEVGENAFENVLNRSSSVDYLKLATVLSKITPCSTSVSTTSMDRRKKGQLSWMMRTSLPYRTRVRRLPKEPRATSR